MKLEFSGKNKNQFIWLSNNYEFRFNVVTNLYEYRKLKKGKVVKGNEWKDFEDRNRNDILLEIFNDDLDLPDNKLNAYIESKYNSPDYDPFEEYFDELEEWESGQKDYIKELAKTIKTKNSEHLEDTLKKFLVATISCLLEPDEVNDVCLVFQSSAQGVGKSRWMRKLLPEKFRSKYLYEGAIDTKNKDHTIYLSQYWFMHLDELETLKGNNIGAIKSYITRQRISERKAYGRYKTSFLRRASFLGSVNEDKFLTDITGNRRWLVFQVTEIDYEHMVDIEGVWAQAYYYYKKGFKYWFDNEEIKKINNINEEFREMSFEEEILLKYFGFPKEVDESNGDYGYFSTTEALMKVQSLNSALLNKMNSSKMGKSLSRHAKLKKQSNGVSKYYLEFSHEQKELPESTQENSLPVAEAVIDYTTDGDVPF